MREAQMWDTLRPKIKSLDPQRIECKTDDGVPDVNYINGWVELKVTGEHFPPDSRGPSRKIISIPHFQPEQRRWLRRRWEAGGLAWLLLRTPREWILLDGVTAGLIGTAAYYVLRRYAAAVWCLTPPTQEICGWLTGTPLALRSKLRLRRLQRGIDGFRVDEHLHLIPGTTFKIEDGDVPLTPQLEAHYRGHYG